MNKWHKFDNNKTVWGYTYIIYIKVPNYTDKIYFIIEIHLNRQNRNIMIKQFNTAINSLL